MKVQISLGLILILTFSSCMSAFLGEKHAIKYPRMGDISAASVGDDMVFFHCDYEKSLTIWWKEAIVYKGISNNVITLTFREWATGSRYDSEPKSSQDFQYTLPKSGEPTEVTLRGYKIRIIEANNNSIKFVLLSGMPNVEGCE